MKALPELFTFKTLSACPDTEEIQVPPLATGKVSEVIAVAENEAMLNVPNDTTD